MTIEKFFIFIYFLFQNAADRAFDASHAPPTKVQIGGSSFNPVASPAASAPMRTQPIGQQLTSLSQSSSEIQAHGQQSPLKKGAVPVAAGSVFRPIVPAENQMKAPATSSNAFVNLKKTIINDRAVKPPPIKAPPVSTAKSTGPSSVLHAQLKTEQKLRQHTEIQKSQLADRITKVNKGHTLPNSEINFRLTDYAKAKGFVGQNFISTLNFLSWERDGG